MLGKNHVWAPKVYFCHAQKIAVNFIDDANEKLPFRVKIFGIDSGHGSLVKDILTKN